MYGNIFFHKFITAFTKYTLHIIKVRHPWIQEFYRIKAKKIVVIFIYFIYSTALMMLSVSFSDVVSHCKDKIKNRIII